MADAPSVIAAFTEEITKRTGHLKSIESHLLPWEVMKSRLKVKRRIQETIKYYVSKLAEHHWVPQVLAMGDSLLSKGEFDLAKQACFEFVLDANLLESQSTSQLLSKEDRSAAVVRAMAGVALCRIAALQDQDPGLQLPSTRTAFMQAMGLLRQAMDRAVASERLYWLVFNVSVHTFRCSSVLLRRGYGADTLPYLVHVVLCVENAVHLCLPRFLPWRVELYRLTVAAFVSAGALDKAKALMEQGIARVKELQDIQALDPVPCPRDTMEAYRETLDGLVSLRLTLELTVPPSDLTPEAADERAREAVPDEGLRLLALVGALLDPRRPMSKRGGLEAGQLAIARVVADIATPHLQAMQTSLRKRDRARSALFMDDAQPDRVAGDATGDGAVQGGAGEEGGEPGDEAAESTEETEAEADAYAKAKDTVGVMLHQSLLVAAYAAEDWDFFDLVATTAHLRVTVDDSSPSVVQDDTDSLRITLRCLEALRSVANASSSAEQAEEASAERAGENGDESGRLMQAVRPAVDVLLSDARRAALVAPDLVQGLGVALLQACRGRLEAYLVRSFDRDAGLEGVLEAIDEAFSAVEFPDAITALSLALKLGSSLDKAGRLQRGIEVTRRAEARAKAMRTRIITTALEEECSIACAPASAEARDIRGQISLKTYQGESVEDGVDGAVHPLADSKWLSRFKWVSAARSQVHTELSPVVAGITDTEQVLACLHADILHLMVRLELRQGILDQSAAAQKRTEKLVTAIETRDAQRLIFGERTLKEVRNDERRLEQAGTTPSNPVAAEKRLQDEFGDNAYARAILCMEMAPYHSTHDKRTRLLQEAHDWLLRAQAQEEALLSSLQRQSPGKRTRPGPPLVLRRSPTSITLSHSALRLKGNRVPAYFAVYGKVHTPGLALSINNTAAEFEGLGIKVPVGRELTIRGLPENRAFLMAVAAYDADGALIGELGESGPEVVPCVALPVLLLHASLAISAANLGAVAVGRASSSLLTGHFIQRTPDRPLWEQNPSDAQTLREGAVREASPQLLRAFVQAMYVGVERLGAETSGPEEGGKGPSGASLRESLVEGQVARVKNAKKILLAMHVAASINDQQLLAEGAVRVNNLLAPLLAMPRKSPFLAKALGSCCVTLRSITDVELHPCQSAMPVATQLTVAAIQVLSEARESDATKLLSALDSTILQAAGVDSQEELVRLHEMLIRDPQLCSEQPAAIAKRIADEEDIIAKVFQKVSLDDIEEVWTEITEESHVIRKHPRFIEMCVRLCQRAYEMGKDDLMLDWAAQVQSWRRSMITFLGLPPRGWKLDEATAASAVTELPADVASVLGEDATDDDRAAALQGERKKDAAARFLQSRLKEILPYGRERRRRREQHTASLGWASRLALQQGLALAAKAAGTRAEEPTEPTDDKEGRGRKEESADDGGNTAEEDDQDLSGFDDAGPDDGEEGRGTQMMEEKGADEVACLEAMRHFACAVELAFRGRCWAAVYNACGDMWDALKMILEVHRDMLLRSEVRAHEVSITMKELNELYYQRHLDMESLHSAPPPTGKDARKESKKEKEPSDGPGLQPRLNVIRGPNNIARVLRAPLVRLLDLVELHMNGTPLADGAEPEEGEPEEDDSFDVGSDKAPDIWFHRRGDMDMRWLLTLVLSAMHIMREKNRCDMMFEIGERFNALSKEVFADKILPLLVAVCPLIGRDIAIYTLSLEKAVRDKNAALEDLERLRTRVQKKLGLLAANAMGGAGRLVRKKPRRFLAEGASQAGSEANTGFDAASEASSMQSSMSSATTGSRRRKKKEPLNVALPKEYTKIIEILKQRQEKELVVQATNELGNIHAHFGEIDLACRGWGDALDALLGPYNCVMSWKGELGQMTPEELMNKFGVKSLLFGIMLLGKLCRYAVQGGIDLRVSASELACKLAAACFKCSFTHPQRQIDFGDYLPQEIVEGAQIFNDNYEMNMPDLLSSLETLSRAAVDNALSALALPLLALAEYLAVYVTRNLYLTVLSRVLRVQLLCHLGCLAPAAAVLVKLIDAVGLPSRSRGGAELMLRDEEGVAVPRMGHDLPPYQAARNPSDEPNAQVVQFIAEQEVHKSVEKVYGSSLIRQLQLARAEFLRACGAVLSGWHNADPETGFAVAKGPEDGAPVDQAPSPGQKYLDAASKVLVAIINTAAKEGVGTVRSRPMSPQKQEPEITDPRILRAQEAARKKGKDKDSKGKPAKKASQKNSKGVAATAPDPDTFEAPVGGAPTDGLGMRGRRLVAQAYLQLSQVREQEWRYRKALDYALEALAWAESSLRDAPDASMVHALDNDVNERSLLPPELWMDCKMTIARLCYRMGSPSAATDALESLRADTRSMQDKWRGWLAEVMTQRCALLQGTILESCRQLKGLLDASRQFVSVFQRQDRAELCIDLGDVLDGLALHKDANELWTNACALMKGSMMDLGVSEMLEAPENRSKTLRGAQLYAESLIRLSIVLTRDTEFTGAVQAASEALRVLDFVSCSPHLKARAALQCARAQVLLVTRPTYMWSHASLPPRVVDAKALLDADWPLRAVLNGERPAPGQPIEKEQVSEAPAAAEEETDGGKKGKAAKADSQRKGKDKDKGKDKGKGKESAPEVQEMYVDGCEDVRPFRVGALDIKHKRAVAALWQLQRAMGWAVLDGGHDRELISDIIKEAVALHVFVEDGHRAGHAMHLASKVDAMALRERSGMPAPVSGSGGLRWAREMVHGREALFLDEQGRFRPPPEEGMKTASEQARTLESGEMLLPLMTQLRQMGRTLGCMFYQEACMQAAAIHSVLVSQSSDYAARLCFARTPVVDPVVPLPVLMRPGVVLATWYGTRAVPEAYEAWSKLHEGVLPAADGKRTLGGMELVSIKQPSSWSVLFVAICPKQRLGESSTDALSLPDPKVFRVPVESHQVRVWRELLVLVRRTLRDWKSKRAPAEPEAPDAGKKGKKGAPPPPADESAAESDAEMPGDLKAFVGSSLRKAFGGLRETVAPPAQRRKRAHPAPSRRSSVQSKLSRALSRRMTMRSLMAGPSGKSDMLERAKQASRILSEEALFGAEGTEEAAHMTEETLVAMLKDNQLDRMLALFDTRTGAAFEDETLGPWLTKLLTKPIESKV